MILDPDVLLPTGPQRWTAEAVGQAWAECRRQLRAALQDTAIRTVAVMVGVPGSGKSAWAREHDQPGLVIFDACWTRVGHRAAMARQIRKAGRAAVAVLVRCPLDVCRDRNAQRPTGRRVPDVALTRAWLALRERPPTLAEGWSRVLVQDGQALRLDAATPEQQVERVAMAPARQALALLRGRVLPAYRAAQASAVGQGAEEPPARITRSVAALGRALGRGAAGATRVGADLGRLGQRLEEREREQWTGQVREAMGQGGEAWSAEAMPELVSDWAEQVGQRVQEIRARVAPGLEQLVADAWRKGWTSAELEAHVVEHGIPLDGGGTAEGQGAVLGRGAHQEIVNSATRAQQEAVGSDEYDWQHSGAKDPDPEHLAANGKRFRWSRRPSFGHPGDRRNCGCRARPVLLPAVVEKLREQIEPEAPPSLAKPKGRSPGAARPKAGGAQATKALRNEVDAWEQQRREALAGVAEQRGPEARSELAELSKRQARVLGNRRGVTPSGGRVKDPTAAKPELDRWIKGLTDEQRDALRDWSTEEWFGRMRAVDSGRGLDEWKPADDAADARILLEAERRMTAAREALARAPRYEGEMTRGLRDLPKGSALRKALETKGAVVEMESVSSWSPDEYEARAFASDDDGAFLVRVVTKRGAVVGDPRVSYTAREGEILLDRGARFRVVSTKRRPGDDHRRLVILEELDPA